MYGLHPGFRRNHAKGVAVTGSFRQQRQRAANYRERRCSVLVAHPVERAILPHPEAIRFTADTAGAARGLGLAFAFPDGTQWRTAMLNLPVFPDNSPQGFYDRLLASKTVPATGKPDPEVMSAFLAAHPETAAAMALIKQHPPTRGFADSTYSSLSTFYLVDDAGKRTPVRWSFVPQQAALSSATGQRKRIVRRADPSDTQRATAVAIDADGRGTR